MGMQTAWKQGNSCSTSHFLVVSCVAHVGLELLFVVAPLLLAHEASPTWRRVTGISATSGRHGPTGPTKNRWGLGNQIFVGLKLEMPQETVGQIINVSLNFGKVETLKLRSLTWVSRWGTFNNQKNNDSMLFGSITSVNVYCDGFLRSDMFHMPNVQIPNWKSIAGLDLPQFAENHQTNQGKYFALGGSHLHSLALSKLQIIVLRLFDLSGKYQSQWMTSVWPVSFNHLFTEALRW